MPGKIVKERKRAVVDKPPFYLQGQVERRITRLQTAPDRIAAKIAADKLKADEAKALAAKRLEALANQPKKPEGQCGDGKLHIAFVQMGQGDCALISTPGGSFVMIDCGSDATEEKDDKAYLKRVSDTIYGKKFLGGTDSSKHLEALILTHADTDHYNKLQYVLSNDTLIHAIYHSDKIESYAGGTSGWLKNHVEHENFINAVTIKADFQLKDSQVVRTVTKTLNGGALGNMDLQNKKMGLDQRGALRIVHEDSCQISILAANHSQDTEGDKSQGNRNRGSVVTLIEAFGKKILICGDATRSTEKFLIDEYKELLANLDLLQAPHHGSNVTSSSDLLVDKLKPKKVIISAGKKVRKDHLPSKFTIHRYLAKQDDKQVTEHEVFYWGYDGDQKINSEFTEKNMYVTGSNLTIELAFP